MTEVEKLKKLTGESDEELLSFLLEDAQEYVLSYTNRKQVIPELKKPIRDLSLIAFNRIGTEGETQRSEAGESYHFADAPKQIYSILDRYRLARVGGKTFERFDENENTEKQTAEVLPQDGSSKKR